MALNPMPNIVLIEPEDRTPTTTSNGFLIEQKFQGAPNIGKVYAVGSDVENIKSGMRVVFNEPSPSGVKHEGVGYLPIDKEKVLGVIHE